MPTVFEEFVRLQGFIVFICFTSFSLVLATCFVIVLRMQVDLTCGVAFVDLLALLDHTNGFNIY